MSRNIITCLCWIKKDNVKKVPDEFKDDSKMKQLEEEFKKNNKITTDESIKAITEKLEGKEDKHKEEEDDDMDMDELDEVGDVPTFSSDFKNHFLDSKNKGDEDYDEISEEDKEDYTIYPTDNLILCATAQDDISNIEVYVYDESQQNLFVHHDILLSSYPLCMEWLSLQEENGIGKANFAVIGSFLPEIEIWNLDSINALEPELVLGDPNTKSQDGTYYKKSKKNTVNPKDTKYHTDAVLGLSLNPFEKKIVASGSADSKIIVWDILKTEPIINYCEHTDKVQAVKFNKCEDNVLLSAGYDHSIKIFDIRNQKSELKINVNHDVESIDFSPVNKYKFLVSYENGLVEEYDFNNLNKPLYSFKAHKKAATSITYSHQLPDLFVTCSMDSYVKVWDSSLQALQNSGEPALLAEKFLKKTTGELFCCKFAEDLDYTIAVGGSKGELLIWQLEQCKTFCDRYGLKWIDETKAGDETNNLARKKLMSNRIKLRKGNTNNTSKGITKKKK